MRLKYRSCPKCGYEFLSALSTIVRFNPRTNSLSVGCCRCGYKWQQETVEKVDKVGQQRANDEPLFEREIGQMVSGESGWTVPWALYDGKLRKDYPVFESRFGTATLEVRCIKRHKYETRFHPRPDTYR